MRQSEVQMIIYLRACLTSLACSDILACGEYAKFEVQGFLVESPVRAIDGSKSLHTTLENKLFVSLSVKRTAHLASNVLIRLICAYCDYFVTSSGLLLFVAYYS